MDRQERGRLIARYREGPALLRDAWRRVPDAARTFRPAPGEWSAHEIVVHCADSETYAATRIRLLVAEPEPVIVGYDQERWARVFDYHAVAVEPALAVIDAVRHQTAALIASLTDADWEKTGLHTESGAYGAADWLASYGPHLHVHVRQIEANMVTWHAARAG